MTAPEVFQVRDGDGWEVYVTNPAGGWWLLGSVGGSAVVDTLPDGAEAMVGATDPTSPAGLRITANRLEEAIRGGFWEGEEKHNLWLCAWLIRDALWEAANAEGGDRRG